VVAQGLGGDWDMRVRLVVVAAVGEADSFAVVDSRLDRSFVVARVGRIRQKGRPYDNSWAVLEQERVLARAPRQVPCQADYIAPVAEELAGLAGCIAGMVAEDLALRIHQGVRLVGTCYFPAADLVVVELGIASVVEVFVELVGRREVAQLSYYKQARAVPIAWFASSYLHKTFAPCWGRHQSSSRGEVPRRCLRAELLEQEVPPRLPRDLNR